LDADKAGRRVRQNRLKWPRSQPARQLKSTGVTRHRGRPAGHVLAADEEISCLAMASGPTPFCERRDAAAAREDGRATSVAMARGRFGAALMARIMIPFSLEPAVAWGRSGVMNFRRLM
jgi:hypothetical protein